MSDHEETPVLFSAARVEASDTPLKHIPGGSDGKKTAGFIWGESCCGQKKDGPQSAPPLVCSEAFIKRLGDLGWGVNVKRVPQVFRATPASVVAVTHAHQPFCVAATCDAIASACLEVHAEGRFPVMIGGDHCLSMGSVAATSAKYGGKFCLIWFDAHADINTIDTSPSGNLHGMPIAALIGLEGMMKVPGFEDNRFGTVDASRIAWIGLRDVDPGEWETIGKLGLKTAHTIDDLKKYGMKRLLEMVLREINPDGTLPVHLSFDVDGMDPIDAPSTGTKVQDGVRIHEAVELVRLLRESGNLCALDVVEVNPSLGGPHEVATTVANAQLIIAQALGAAI
jgi:arginase